MVKLLKKKKVEKKKEIKLEKKEALNGSAKIAQKLNDLMR